MVALRALIAGVMEKLEPLGGNTTLKKFVNEAFSSLGKALGNFGLEILHNPHMSRAQVLALAREHALEVGKDLPGALATAIIGQKYGNSAECVQLEHAVNTALHEAYEKAVEAALPIVLP